MITVTRKFQDFIDRAAGRLSLGYGRANLKVYPMLKQRFLAIILGLVTFTVSGPTMAWVVDENYDSQNVGERCGNFWLDQKDSTVSGDKSSSGGRSCKFATYQGNYGFGGGFVLPSSLKRGDELWIRFRLYIPAGFDFNAYGDGDMLKFVRISTRDTSGTESRLDWYWQQEGRVPPYATILERDQCTTNCWQRFGAGGEGPVRGVWETYEMYAKFDTVPVDSGGQGRVRAWKNGKLIGDLTNRPTLNNASDIVHDAMIFSYWNGGAPKSQSMYFDDLVTTNVTPAATDSAGNRYIGVGNFVAVSPPLYPSGIH